MSRKIANLCRACDQDFASVRQFDLHRVGKHASAYEEGLRMDPPRDDGRRCLSVEEIEARGWERNDQGRWHDPAATRAVAEAFRRRREAVEASSE